MTDPNDPTFISLLGNIVQNTFAAEQKLDILNTSVAQLLAAVQAIPAGPQGPVGPAGAAGTSGPLTVSLTGTATPEATA